MKSRLHNKIYVGKTLKDPRSRVQEHNNGANIWSKSNGPFDLVYYESYLCSIDATRRELFYKTGLGRHIKKLIVDYITTFKENGM